MTRSPSWGKLLAHDGRFTTKSNSTIRVNCGTHQIVVFGLLCTILQLPFLKFQRLLWRVLCRNFPDIEFLAGEWIACTCSIHPLLFSASAIDWCIVVAGGHPSLLIPLGSVMWLGSSLGVKVWLTWLCHGGNVVYRHRCIGLHETASTMGGHCQISGWEADPEVAPLVGTGSSRATSGALPHPRAQYCLQDLLTYLKPKKPEGHMLIKCCNLWCERNNQSSIHMTTCLQH